jgi:hypothetical protein
MLVDGRYMKLCCHMLKNSDTFTCRRYHLQRIAAQDDTRNVTKAQLYTTAKYT